MFDSNLVQNVFFYQTGASTVLSPAGCDLRASFRNIFLRRSDFTVITDNRRRINCFYQPAHFRLLHE
jgi:hypothetical protein